MERIDPVKLGAILDKLTTLKDGSVKLIFETQELDRDKAADLIAMRNQLGWLVFAPNGTPQVDIPSEPAREFKDDVSPSQRLRNVLFVYWKQLGGTGIFEDFYKSKINRWIDAIKERLDPAA
jgi:hypothetical protein